MHRLLPSVKQKKQQQKAGLQEGRRRVYNEKNQPVIFSEETAKMVIYNHLGKQVRPDVPMRRNSR
jgi:hypothetical protein